MYTDIQIQELKNKYKLSDYVREGLLLKIFHIFLSDKYMEDKPKAIINLGPPGSGKNNLNLYCRDKEFSNQNVVLINGDVIKMFHPYYDEVVSKYPEIYASILGEDANYWTSSLFDECLKRKYNVIFEGTGRSLQILNTIETKMKDYDVTVNAYAVSKINCLLSILERWVALKSIYKYGRLLMYESFNTNYFDFPNNIDEIEKKGYKVNVYKRGENNLKEELKLPVPHKIYDSNNKNDFSSAKSAIYAGRQEDAYNSFFDIQKRISLLDIKPGENEEVDKIMNEANRLYNLMYQEIFGSKFNGDTSIFQYKKAKTG